MRPVISIDIHGGSLNAWKVAAIFLPFGLGLLLTIRNYLDGVSMAVFGLTMLALVVIICISGMVAKFPVWSLPSMGFLSFILYFYFLRLFAQGIVYRFVLIPAFHGWPHDLPQRILALLLISFITLFIIAGLVLVCLGLFPKFRDGIRKDWTIMSFFLYGLAILPMFIYDEFHHLDGYRIASLLCLAIGVGAYLKIRHQGRRILALLVPVVLSQIIIGIGLFLTYPLEPWIDLTNPYQRIWESIQFLADPLPAVLFLPILVYLVPQKEYRG